jgi:hypothetical protein
MPLFGDRGKFAVEFSLDDDHGGVWLFGRLCFWVGDARVGDFENGTSLRDALFCLEGISKYANLGRRNPRFSGVAGAEVFRLLNSAFYESMDAQLQQTAEDEQWIRHNVRPSLDVFDDCRIYRRTRTVASCSRNVGRMSQN